MDRQFRYYTYIVIIIIRKQEPPDFAEFLDWGAQIWAAEDFWPASQ